MVLGNLTVPGRPTVWMIVGQGPTASAAGVGGGCLDFFTLISRFSPLYPSLWETARYGLKYCLKRPLIPHNNQPTNLYTSSLKYLILLYDEQDTETMSAYRTVCGQAHRC